MADCVLMLPELSVDWNVAAWLWIIIAAYEMTMLDLDGRQNERKHIVKLVLLLAILIVAVVYLLA